MRLWVFQLFLLLSSGCAPRPDAKLARVTEMLAQRVWFGTWKCAGQDWNQAGYPDLVRGEVCGSSPAALRRFVENPEVVAAVLSPSGAVGVVGGDGQCCG